VTKPFSLAFKQKMMARLTGKDAVSARQLALETGLRQQTLSRWLQEASSLPIMPAKRPRRDWYSPWSSWLNEIVPLDSVLETPG
jgi:transposase